MTDIAFPARADNIASSDGLCTASYVASVLSVRLSMRDVADRVCARHGVSLAELRSRSRATRLNLIRQEFMALAYELQQTSYPMIGRFLRRHHTTVIYGVRQHWARMGTAR